LGAKIDVVPAFDLQLFYKPGIHAGAGCGQRMKRSGHFQRTIGDHAAGGVGGFASGFAFFQQQDFRALLAEFASEREADDSSADYDHVPGLHQDILEEGKRMCGWQRIRARIDTHIFMLNNCRIRIVEKFQEE
jgi:hypothetical protein